MKVKTQDLTGPALDWAVAKCEWDELAMLNIQYPQYAAHFPKIAPSTDWAHGGPIIEREEIGLRMNVPCSPGRTWEGRPSPLAKGAGGKFGYGPTPLIAAMRCYCYSKLGDEIDIPEELQPCQQPNL